MEREKLLEMIEQTKREKWTSLDLYFQEINELASDIGQLSNLTHLYFGHNKLTALPPEIDELTNLPPETEDLTQLQRLYLNDNQLTELPKHIERLTNLKEIHLYGNEFNELPKEICIRNLTIFVDLDRICKLPPEIIGSNIKLIWNDLEISFLPDNHLEIGCQSHSLSYWAKNYRQIAAKYKIKESIVNRLSDLLIPLVS